MNKANVHKTAAKKRQAFSYQQSNYHTLKHTDKKLKLDTVLELYKTPPTEVIELETEESTTLSSHLKSKPNLKNFCIPCQKVVPTNMTQHKKGQKHKDNE